MKACFRRQAFPAATEGFLPAVLAVCGVHQVAGLSILYLRQGPMYQMNRDRTFADG
jgi:hypothetical protein